MAGSVDRSRSGSSIRSSILPRAFLAYSQLNARCGRLRLEKAGGPRAQSA